MSCSDIHAGGRSCCSSGDVGGAVGSNYGISSGAATGFYFLMKQAVSLDIGLCEIGFVTLVFICVSRVLLLLLLLMVVVM